MPYTYRCRHCSRLTSSCLATVKCPSCGHKALRQYKTKEYIKQSHAPSHKLDDTSNVIEYEKGDF